ncbi:MAG: glycosyltransferase family 4 protein, partial [Candidatus Hodarchaeales archaeon]
MKILLLYDLTSSDEIAAQGALLYRGLVKIGVKVQCVHFESAQEKEWYYDWFKPDVVVGIGH